MEIEFPINIKVRVNKPKTQIVSFSDGIYLIDIKEKAENNKANIEIVKFLSRLIGQRVRIVSGLKSKKKKIDVL